MVVRIIGFKEMDFVPDGETKHVKGVKFYVSYPLTGVFGEFPDDKFVSNDSSVDYPEEIVIGQKYDFVFEGFGKHQKLTKIVPAFDDNDASNNKITGGGKNEKS